MLLEGKKLLVTGVLTRESIAYAAAQALQEQGAEIVLTSFGRAMGLTEKSARRLPDPVDVLEMDANDPAHIESVSAEDIGKLPDASIAESIARLPGLTSQRLSGRANVISIRGFGPDFSMTLLNGREQTSTGDNRAVEFDQ